MTETGWQAVFDAQKLMDEKQWGEADAFLGQALAAASGQIKWSLLLQKSRVCSSLSDFSRGIATLREAVALRPSLGEAHDTPEVVENLANDLQVFGDTETAAALVDQLSPDQRNVVKYELRRRLDIGRQLAARVAGHRQQRRIVSLGQNCMADSLVKRWGLAPNLVDGPFSTNLTNGDGPTMAVETDFADLTSSGAIKMGRLPGGSELPLHARKGGYIMLMNHEVGPFWTRDDFKELRRLYSGRIERFRQALGQPCLLISVRATAYEGRRLQDAVRAAASDYRLLILNMMPKGAAPCVVDQTDPRTRVLNLSPPYKADQWYLNYNTIQGVAFEEPVARLIAEEVGWAG